MLDVNNITKEISSDNYKELPLYFPPPVYYGLYPAIKFSIILSSPKTFPWFYSNFMQLKFDQEKFETQIKYDDDKKRKLGFKDHILHIYPVEELKNYRTGASLFLNETDLSSNIFKFNEKTLISEMIEYLNNGFYITTHVDVSRLPGTRYYKGIPSVHSVLIFAYDLENKCFKHFDFNSNDSISIVKIKFDDFINAFFSDSVPESQRIDKMHSKYYLSLFKINEENDFTFNVETVKQQLSDYLNSSNTSNRYNLLLPERKGIYGVDVYDAIIEYIKTTSSINDTIDYRLFHVIYEHKKIMTYRFKYFESIGILDPKLNISEKFADIEKKANILRHTVMKYMLMKDADSLKKVMDEINEICAQEKPLIEEGITHLGCKQL